MLKLTLSMHIAHAWILETERANIFAVHSRGWIWCSSAHTSSKRLSRRFYRHRIRDGQPPGLSGAPN